MVTTSAADGMEGTAEIVTVADEAETEFTFTVVPVCVVKVCPACHAWLPL
jgi:hypothetical protein